MDVPVVVNEAVEENAVGDQVGQCKWFNDKLGYGFITVQAGKDKGKDIFVHHSGIKPLNSNYKTLKKGEYINFNVIDGDNGLQAVNVTGIGGGTLMCDVLPSIKIHPPMMPMPIQMQEQGYTVVQYHTPHTTSPDGGGRGGRGRGGGGGRGYGHMRYPPPPPLVPMPTTPSSAAPAVAATISVSVPPSASASK